MTALLYSSLDDEPGVQLSLSNRGLCYGDGLFETIRVVGYQAPLIAYHRQRFERSCEVMGFDALNSLADFDAICERALIKLDELGHPRALIKIFAIRSEGGRGYTPAPQSHPEFYYQLFELPAYPIDFYHQGVDTKICRYRLSEQPALAGIKHLNRLDQVLASRELNGLAEGILLDGSGHVVEGTKSNILVFTEDDIHTPRIVTCGVAGVLREALLESNSITIKEKDILPEDLHSASGIALINSVFGLWPVRCLDGHTLPIAPACRALQSHISQQFAFPE